MICVYVPCGSCCTKTCQGSHTPHAILPRAQAHEPTCPHPPPLWVGQVPAGAPLKASCDGHSRQQYILGTPMNTGHPGPAHCLCHLHCPWIVPCPTSPQARLGERGSWQTPEAQAGRAPAEGPRGEAHAQACQAVSGCALSGYRRGGAVAQTYCPPQAPGDLKAPGLPGF